MDQRKGCLRYEEGDNCCGRLFHAKWRPSVCGLSPCRRAFPVTAGSFNDSLVQPLDLSSVKDRDGVRYVLDCPDDIITP